MVNNYIDMILELLDQGLIPKDLDSIDRHVAVNTALRQLLPSDQDIRVVAVEAILRLRDQDCA